MKIYSRQEPPVLIRVHIHQSGTNSVRFAISDSTLEECFVHINKTVMNMPENHTMKRTTVELRHCVGKMNGKSKSISKFTVCPEELKDIIVKSINDSLIRE